MIDTEALRKKVIDLAIQGKLTEQLPTDGDAETLYAQIQEEKARLVKEGKIKKDKALPEITDDEIPFEIPDSWKWVRIGNVINEVIVPQRDKPSFSGDIPWCRIEDKDGLYLNGTKSGQYVSKETVERMNLRIFPVGTVLSACSGASIGTILITTVECCTNQTFNGLVCNSMLHNWFLFWHLKSEINKLKKMGSGSAMAYISQDKIRNMVMPLPPYAEQKRITCKIDEVLSYISIIDDLQKKYSHDLAILKSKIIDAGIRGKLTEQLPEDGDTETLYERIQEGKAKLIKEGKIKKEKPLGDITEDEIPFEIPKNWKWVRLGNISAKISSGNTPAGGKKANVYVEEGYCFFREQNIYDDGIHEEGLVYISEELINSRPNSTVLPNDLLLNITGGSIGRCAMVPENFSKGSINQHILIIRMIDYEIRTYVHKVICSTYGQKHIKGNAVGDKDGFSGGRCKNMLIPLPPLEEQYRIVAKIEELLPYCGKLVK